MGFKGSLPQRPTRDPRADDGRGSGNAGRLRRFGDGDLSSRRGMVQGMDDMVGGGKIIKQRFPCLRCSATRRPCARCRKAVPRTAMEFGTTAKLRKNVQDAIITARGKYVMAPGALGWVPFIESSFNPCCPKASRRDAQRIEKR